VLGDYML